MTDAVSGTSLSGDNGVTIPTTLSNDAVKKLNGTTNAKSANGLADLGSDTFLKLLVAQMRYQNPFSPGDPSAMLGQVATFTQVESLQKLVKSNESASALNQAGMAASFVGKSITGVLASGTVTGNVASVRFGSDGPTLVLDTGKEVPLTSVSTLGATTTAPAAPAAPSNTSNSSTTPNSSGSSNNALASYASA
jgi:flagellar basal-body rod modification protein FlgD